MNKLVLTGGFSGTSWSDVSEFGARFPELTSLKLGSLLGVGLRGPSQGYPTLAAMSRFLSSFLILILILMLIPNHVSTSSDSTVACLSDVCVCVCVCMCVCCARECAPVRLCTLSIGSLISFMQAHLSSEQQNKLVTILLAACPVLEHLTLKRGFPSSLVFYDPSFLQLYLCVSISFSFFLSVPTQVVSSRCH